MISDPTQKARFRNERSEWRIRIMCWYVKQASADQAIIADEQSGKTIALVYDKKHANVLAAAQDMQEALDTAVTIMAPGRLRMQLEYALKLSKGM
jgi:aspartate carbamoyltransferase catalytic subunit